MIENRPREYFGRRRLDLSGVEIDLEHRHKTAWLLQKVHRCSLRDCAGRNSHTSKKGEGHDLQVLDCGQNEPRLRYPARRFIRFKSISDKPNEVEDRLSVFGSHNCAFWDCTTAGPVTETGSGLCLDLGAAWCRVYGGNYGGGIVICDGADDGQGNGHLLEGVTMDSLSVSNEWYKGKNADKPIIVHVYNCEFKRLYIRKHDLIRVYIDGKLHPPCDW